MSVRGTPKYTNSYKAIMHSVEFRNIHRMSPRQRDYLGIRRSSYTSSIENDVTITIWLIDPIPFCELKGLGWCGCMAPGCQGGS